MLGASIVYSRDHLARHPACVSGLRQHSPVRVSSTVVFTSVRHSFYSRTCPRLSHTTALRFFSVLSVVRFVSNAVQLSLFSYLLMGSVRKSLALGPGKS